MAVSFGNQTVLTEKHKNIHKSVPRESVFFCFFLCSGIRPHDYFCDSESLMLWHCLSCTSVTPPLPVYRSSSLWIRISAWICLCFVINRTSIMSPVLYCCDCTLNMTLVCMLEEGKVFHDDYLFSRRGLESLEPVVWQSPHISLNSIFSCVQCEKAKMLCIMY